MSVMYQCMSMPMPTPYPLLQLLCPTSFTSLSEAEEPWRSEASFLGTNDTAHVMRHACSLTSLPDCLGSCGSIPQLSSDAEFIVDALDGNHIVLTPASGVEASPEDCACVEHRVRRSLRDATHRRTSREVAYLGSQRARGRAGRCAEGKW